jgi:hypothetical protein
MIALQKANVKKILFSKTTTYYFSSFKTTNYNFCNIYSHHFFELFKEFIIHHH